ncbi:MAG: agmatinase [Verrucomicrobia bacterium]|nr:agmatinase [Verrucomicrobiota bacterium]
MVNNFLNISEEYASLEHASTVILPIPFDHTTSYQKGTNKGPEAIIEASSYVELFDIETEVEAYKQGIHTAKAVSAKTSEEMLKAVYTRVKEFLDQGKFVVSLGGEHSISEPIIRAHTDRFGPLTVLQLDAHADLMPALGGNPLSHGSVMARTRENKAVDRIVSVGIRSMDIEEFNVAEKENTFYAHDVLATPLDAFIEKVLKRLSPNVYITFDLDVFDSSLMPSTGTPEPGGLFWHHIMPLLKRVAKECNIVGFDIVELMPLAHLKAPDFLAAKAIYKMLSYNMLYSKQEVPTKSFV